MDTFLTDNGILFQEKKLYVPTTIKNVKLDIGLSYSAPFSQTWLSNEDNSMVFGFEPNPTSITSIKSANNCKRDPSHGDVLDVKYLHTRFFLIPCALGTKTNEYVDFYVMNGDEGCSSLYEPNPDQFPENYTIKEKIKVPIFKLSDFFELFPFDQIPYIDYIKVDAQGSDLDIIKSGGEWIQNHVVYITVEAENNQYKNPNENSEEAIQIYMTSIGFIHVQHPNTADPTYLNTKYLDLADAIYICQK